MKLYTKTGDKGQTSLFGGERVLKFELRIEAYGSMDELNAWVGLLRSELMIFPEFQKTDLILLQVQNLLFTAGSYLATPEKKNYSQLPPFNKDFIFTLEQEMDEQAEVLPPLREFVLPGGHKAASLCHVARTLTRKTERRVVELHQQHPQPEEIVIFLNRLSDYFFSLARYVNFKLEFQETPWNKES